MYIEDRKIGAIPIVILVTVVPMVFNMPDEINGFFVLCLLKCLTVSSDTFTGSLIYKQLTFGFLEGHFLSFLCNGSHLP